ncbi:hypothetical protein IEO21_07066 [Rhodonia placenta]|uniref:Inositol polyphosphate-related phosphatase domain-containing protein n=1 Tax=Rhodonia placenta TaxID=104341 RepID=A0A8H7NYW7_9APHY|nr:hypothetical protein IEO21_07066 [Postia placenta]
MDDVATGKTESPHSEGARVEGRILAVISHRDDATSREEGCVFVYKMKPGLRSPLLRSSDNYFLEHAYPIVGDFSMTMAQARRNTIDLRQASAGTALSQPRTGSCMILDLTVTLNPGHDENAAPLILVAHDTQSLKEVITECKRLREISSLVDYSKAREHSEAFGAYTWLAPYIAEARRPPLLSSIPPDLRNLKQPLSVFLSSATAGQPGDEASDIALIRADWMRRKVEAMLIPTCKAGRTLRLRIGTFNVNGKMPSQDLSVWLRHRDSGIAFIPPAKAISPLSLGEIARDPFDTAAQSCHERTAPSESSDILASDRADPDIFVLAFQELDLSTEALLYSTKTVREDAWVTAIFAGLGEKAVLYEKVSSVYPEYFLASKQLVGMLLIVVVKKMLKPSFDDIQTASIGAGIMGLMGNKGATALRLNYIPLSSDGHRPRPIVLTFVNSHLAAFDEMYERRNADFHDLSKRLVFDSGITDPPELNQGTTGNATTIPISVFESDALFWMAYLNYRINLSDADIRSLLLSPPELRQSETRLLLQYDQLSTARRKKHAFENFLEHPITHPP